MRRRDFIGSLLGALASKALPLGAQLPAVSPELSIKRVLVMFKCHFDAGFIDTQRAVVQRYFTEFFPNAMALASQLRDSGGGPNVAIALLAAVFLRCAGKAGPSVQQHLPLSSYYLNCIQQAPANLRHSNFAGFSARFPQL